MPSGETSFNIVHRVTPDTGAVILLSSAGTANNYLTFVKTYANGTIQWSKRWVCSGAPTVSNISITPDSGFIISYVTSRYFILRFDRNGNMLYAKRVDVTSPYTLLHSSPQVIAKGNGNCYIIGALQDTSSPYPYRDVRHVFELDSVGTVLWSHIYSENDFGVKPRRISVDTFANGDLAILGDHYDSSTTQYYPQITRITPTGALVWSKYYSGSGNIPFSLVVVPGNEIVVANEANSSTGLFNLMRCDGQGNVLWSYTFASPSLFHIAPAGGELMEAENNTTVLWGYSFYASGTVGLMIKNDSDGTALCQRYYPNMIMTSRGDILPGQRYSAIGESIVGPYFEYLTTDLCGQICYDSTFAITKTPLPVTVVTREYDTLLPLVEQAFVPVIYPFYLSLQEICTDLVSTPELSPRHLDIFPVPATDQIHIESETALESAELIDVQGRVVFTQQLQGAHAAVLELPKLADGIYLLRLSGSDNMIVQRKILIQQEQ